MTESRLLKLTALFSVAVAAGCGAPVDDGAQSSAGVRTGRVRDAATGKRLPQIDADARQHLTGGRELTPEERAREAQRAKKLVGVRPTALGLERMRRQAAQPQRQVGRAQRSADLSALAREVAAPGSDLITQPAGTPSEALYADEGSALASGAALVAGELPSVVDNSELPAFPEIRNQDGLGACVAFAVTYYQYTHEVGLIAGWDNKNSDNTTKMSPKWTYNLVSLGGDGGSAAPDIYEILEHHGALTWAEFPYVGDPTNPLNFREWPRDAQTWRNALRFKAVEHGELQIPTTPDSMERVKRLLVNGHVLAFSTYAYSWNYDFVDDDPSTADDDAFVDQRILTLVDGSEGSHGMTVVGYNDDLWVDYDADGVVDAGEKGAFKVANSWGSDWWNSGYAWVAYDALNAAPTVPGAPAGTARQRAMTSLYWVTARADYQPDLVAEVTLAAAERSALELRIATLEPAASEPFAVWHPAAFQRSGGSYAFDGTTTTEPQSGSFAFDLSSMAPSFADLRFQVALGNNRPIEASLSGLTLTDRLVPGARIESPDPAVIVHEGETKAQSVRYQFRDPSRVPELVVEPPAVDFGDVALGSSGSQSLVLGNAGTGDLLISSSAIDMPLFDSLTATPLTIRPGEQATVNLRFSPVAGQGESGNLVLHSNDIVSPASNVALHGAGTSSNESAPFLLYVTRQNGMADNSIAMRIELVSHAPMPARISDYKIVYYINEPELDLSQLVWDTYWTNARTPIGFSARRLFFTKALGPRTADTALELTFPEGTVVYPGESLIIDGSLHRGDWQWNFDESDDWSRYARRDGLAENMVIQRIETRGMLFGSSPEGQIPGTYVLRITPSPVSGDATATFFINDPSLVGSFIPIELARDGSHIQHWMYRIMATGEQSYAVPLSYYAPGRYAIVLNIGGTRVDFVEFDKI